MTPEKLSQTEGTLKALNPIATVIKIEQSVIDLDELLGTGLFDYDVASKPKNRHDGGSDK